METLEKITEIVMFTIPTLLIGLSALRFYLTLKMPAGKITEETIRADKFLEEQLPICKLGYSGNYIVYPSNYHD